MAWPAWLLLCRNFDTPAGAKFPKLGFSLINGEVKNMFKDGKFFAGGNRNNCRVVTTKGLPGGKEIGSRTMEVWVKLADNSPRGSGLMTIQSSKNDDFESIVWYVAAVYATLLVIRTGEQCT